MEIDTPTKSWIAREMERPLCALRRGLQGIVDKTELQMQDFASVSAIESMMKSSKASNPSQEGVAEAIRESRTKVLDFIEEEGDKLWEQLSKEYPGAFPFEKNEWKRALSWVREPGKLQPSSLDQPSVQAVWGAALMLNKHLGYPRDEKEILLGNKRLIDEKNLMASLLLGTIKSRKATIAWGKTGSWFYNDPTNNHINMDPGQALLLGLQNSRSILLHEVGHSQITGDRSNRMKEIQARIEELCPKAGRGFRKLPDKKEDQLEVQKLSREYSMREAFWQYAEDACVNTYGEIEGSNFTNDIVTANLRIYTIILLGREHKALLEKQLSKSHLSGLEKALEKIAPNPFKIKPSKAGKSGKGAPTAGGAPGSEIMVQIESRLKAAAAAYPLSRGWINLENEQEWELLGAKKEPEAIELYQKLSKPRNSFSIGEEMPIGAIQPSIIGKRFELVSDTTVNRLTKECIEERNRLIDETFDQYILPLIQMLPDPPEPEVGPGRGPKPPEGEGKGPPVEGGQPVVWEEGEGEGEKDKDKDPPEGQGPPAKEGEGEEEGRGQPINGRGKKPDNTVEEETKTIEDSIKESEKEREKDEAERKKRSEDALKKVTEALRNSMGTRSQLEELPTGCGNYQEAAEALRPQIGIVTSILKKIALKQKTKKPGEMDILPDPIRGIASFDRDSFIERKKKEALGEEISMEDRKHFRHEDNTAKKPTTTHLAFYIDGSGSMSGDQAEKTMMTLVIFNEAAKRVPEIQVSAVYSGAEETVTLLSGGKIVSGQEQLIANILKGGYAWGDNEISPQGLAEMNTQVEKAIPKSGAFGMTHTIFMTDGWVCGSDRESIAKAIKTTLDGNPLSTFDTFILNGGEGGAFKDASDSIKTKKAAQMPTVKNCSDIKDTCPAIVQTLLSRIRTFKSFSPQHISDVRQKIKKTKKKLMEQENAVVNER